MDYALSRHLPAGRLPDGRRKGLLALATALNVGLLLYFKYANFFVDNLNAWLGRFGVEPLAWAAVALPIGISFFTFQKVSYLVDVYRGTAQPARNAADYLLYVALFPQLIAGDRCATRRGAAADRARARPRAVLHRHLRFCQGQGKSC